MSKYTFHGKHGDSHGIDSEQGSLATLMRLRDVENTVFEFTFDARLSKCKQYEKENCQNIRKSMLRNVPFGNKGRLN